MSMQTGGFLHPSVVYCAWAVKLFWEGDPAAKKKREMTSSVCAVLHSLFYVTYSQIDSLLCQIMMLVLH